MRPTPAQLQLSFNKPFNPIFEGFPWEREAIEQYKEIVKRDMEYVRELLLKIEGGNKLRMENLLPEGATDEDLQKLRYHLGMLVDEAGLVRAIPAHSMQGKYWLDIELTWAGHEFVETVRDPEVWRRTKEGAKK